MEHNKLPDPVAAAIRSLEKQIEENEKLIQILLDKNGICLTEEKIDDKVKFGDLFNENGD